MKDRNGIEQSGRYVVGVRCGNNHSGNDRLAGPTGGSYECCGCGTFYSPSDVRAAQRGPVGGQKGGGGLYRVLLGTLPWGACEWEVPAWADEVVRGEMQNHPEILRRIARCAFEDREIGQSLKIHRQAKKFETIFA